MLGSIFASRTVEGSRLSILTQTVPCRATYDILCRLVRDRNQAAHKKSVELELSDFPTLSRILCPLKVQELERRRDSHDGHYIALLCALETHFISELE
jgi:hypothetical protein